MSKRIDTTLTEAEWRAVLSAIDSHTIDLDDRAAGVDQADARRARLQRSALDRAFRKLRGRSGVTLQGDQ